MKTIITIILGSLVGFSDVYAQGSNEIAERVTAICKQIESYDLGKAPVSELFDVTLKNKVRVLWKIYPWTESTLRVGYRAVLYFPSLDFHGS